MTRRPTTKEVKLLEELIGQDYKDLISALSLRKTRAMIQQKWKAITTAIKKLSDKDKSFAAGKVKCKWFDVKSLSKKTIAYYKKECSKAGGCDSKVHICHQIFNLKLLRS